MQWGPRPCIWRHLSARLPQSGQITSRKLPQFWDSSVHCFWKVHVSSFHDYQEVFSPWVCLFAFVSADRVTQKMLRIDLHELLKEAGLKRRKRRFCGNQEILNWTLERNLYAWDNCGAADDDDNGNSNLLQKQLSSVRVFFSSQFLSLFLAGSLLCQNEMAKDGKVDIMIHNLM